ncbi:MAG TPA: hypothetical protein VJ810_02070 [Blastocatellia bacterium]|nr:hypothetical protein [Blastocatellia bacterium]
MKSKTLWITMFCLALVAAMTIIGGARLSARAKQRPADSPAESAQQDLKKAHPIADKIDPETLAIMRRQEAFTPAIAALYEAIGKFTDSGFASIAFEDDGLALYWKGELPTEIIAALSVAREFGPVEIKPAPFSLAEMEAEATKIESNMKALGRGDIQSIVARYDGSGLNIERMPFEVAENVSLARTRAGKKALRSAEQVLAGLDLRVPIHVSTAEKPVKLMVDRFHDNPAWNGGGYFESRRNNVVRGRCTTGFGIRFQNRTWVLTAAHCATAPDVAYQGCNSDPYVLPPTQPCTGRPRMGPVTRQHDEHDLILIDAPGYHRMFDNPQPPDGHPWKNVYGAEGWTYGKLLCQSGARSGVICGIRTGNRIPWTMPFPGDSDGDWGYTIRNLTEAIQINGQIAGQPGDSGGPVFSLLGDGVIAKGTVTGGDLGSYLVFSGWENVSAVYPGVVPVTP